MTPPLPPPDQSWSHCFACGPAESHGLQMHYAFVGEEGIVAELIFDQRFQGFEGVVHGGILATALDDAMANIACLKGERALTVELTTRFLKPVLVGERVRVEAEVVERRKRLMRCRGRVVDGAGVVRAEAEGKFLVESGSGARRAAI